MEQTDASKRTFNLAQFKQHWRTLCADHGLNPIDGSYASGKQASTAQHQQTSYGKALAVATATKASHHRHMRSLVYSRQYTKLHPKPDEPEFWIYLFGDDRGGINWDKVELHASRRWWEQSSLWIPGTSRFITDHRIDVKMNGDPEPQPEIKAVCLIRVQAEKIEKQYEKLRIERLPQIQPTNAELRGILNDIYLEMREEVLPLKRLQQKQIEADKARRRRLNEKLTVVKSVYEPGEYTYL